MCVEFGGLTCSTQVAQVRVALSHCQETGTVLGVAGASTTSTPREPVLTLLTRESERQRER